MRRVFAAGVFLACMVLLTGVRPGVSGEVTSVKEALQAFNEFIGMWKGNGSHDRNGMFWKESADWSWRFKGKDVWISLELKGSKVYKRGEVRYLPDKSVYTLTLYDAKDKASTFEGTFKKSRFVAERTDKEKDETQQVRMFRPGDIRFVYELWVKPANRTLFAKEFQVAMTKEGESFGAAAKKAECIVTGGLGTITVMYKGTTYYVCCSGCRDAFNDEPEKYIKEFNAKKKKK